MTRPSSPRVASKRSVSGTSSMAARVVPNAGWRFPHSRWWMSHAGALLLSPVRRRRRARKPEEAIQAELEETQVDFYKQQLREHRHRLPLGVRYHCVDGYYAKKKYIDEVVSLKLHAITKLRSDADCC